MQSVTSIDLTTGSIEYLPVSVIMQREGNDEVGGPSPQPDGNNLKQKRFPENRNLKF